MNIETIIQNCGTYIAIGQIREAKQTEINRISNPPSSRIVDIEESVEFSGWDYLHATTAGHIGHFAGNPAHASIHTDFNRVIKILDVTADKFPPKINTLNRIRNNHHK